MSRPACLLPIVVAMAFFVVVVPPTSADEKKLAESLRKISPNVIAVEGKTTKQKRDELRRMLSRDIRARRRKVNVADVKAWRSLKTVKQWEAFRDKRIAALRKSLGTFPEPPADLKMKVTKTIPGEGYVIRNIVFQSRPGLWVTANLYSPPKPGKSMPGILICHSHHRPKTQGELQDMGMIWARAGCHVLVMDQLGHGERRQHPFRTSKDYAKSFRVSRQDYYFRYNTGIQLHLLGDSLMGWMTWDLQRGVDLLLKQPGIDPKRIIHLGAVAGGGDPCAVTAAIDKRIAAAVPFNFGGPQPENVFPLPKDAEFSFNYMGGGSWESTRNLRLNGRDGFLPWVIVGSIAPRRLIYAHEFSWDKEHDPVWKRFQMLYKRYGKPEHLTSTHGYGKVTLSSKVASHCTNIGAHHRKAGIYAAFKKWFGIPAPKTEYRNRVKESELLCVDPPLDGNSKSSAAVELTPMHQLAGTIAEERISAVKQRLRGKSKQKKRDILQKAWSRILGDVNLAPGDSPGANWPVKAKTTVENGIRITRFVANVEREVRVPGIVLRPNAKKGDRPRPVVVCVSQSGKEAFLKNRADVVATFLDAGFAVCIPDLRGTGETRPGTYRGRRSYATGLSSSELMLGGTLVGQRLKDLRTVIALLRSRKEFDGKRIALWGDSFAKINPPDRNVAVPLRINNEPDHNEPLGHLLVLLAALFEDDVKAAVSHRGGLVSFRSVLDSQFVYIPHDAVVPGAIVAGDLPLLANAGVQTPLWIAGLTTGENKPAAVKSSGYRGDSNSSDKKSNRIVLRDKPNATAAATWLIDQLK